MSNQTVTHFQDQDPTLPNPSRSVELITIDHACKIMSISRPTLYRILEKGKIKVYRPTPSSPRLDKEEVQAYILSTYDDQRGRDSMGS